MLEFVTMDVVYEQQALNLYNDYIHKSTATFSVKPLTQIEMNKLLYSGLERFPSYAVLYDGDFAGYAMLNRYKPREAYDGTAEVTIYLDDGFHGKGIGTAAMEHMEAVAKGHDFRALLGVICEENKPSIALFEKMDYFKCAHFREVGKKFGRILDVVIYEKLI